MKIIDKRENGVCQFKELNIGDIFSCDGFFFMKIKQVHDSGTTHNAIVLSGQLCGTLSPFQDDELVILRTGSLVLE